jgi:hypothetical protein
MLRLMTDVEAIELYALHSGFTMLAILELRPELARIARQMHERGVTRIPSHLWTADGQASNLLILLLRQASKVRNPKIEHDLRNLTGIRCYWKA